MENQFQFAFRTGNVIVDTMIAGIIITATSYLFKSVTSNNFDFEFFLSIFGFGHNKIIIAGRSVKVNPTNSLEQGNFSIRFRAVLHQVKRSGYSKSGVKQMVESSDSDLVSSPFIVAQKSTFMLEPEVYCKIMKQAQDTLRDPINTPPTFIAEVSSKTKNVEELEMLICSWVKEYTLYIQETGENRIELTGSLVLQSFNFSNKFMAVLHKMNLLDINKPDIKTLKELHLEEPRDRYSFDRYNENQAQKEKREANNLLPEVCQIEKDVFCRVQSVQENEKIHVSITLFSEILNVYNLSELLDKWEREYDDFNQVKVGLKYFVFNQKNENMSVYVNGNMMNPSSYTEFSFESVKSFNNVFFPEKETLFDNIDFFEKNEVWFTERGIPYTFGLLFHGEPGCGKTSTIKAIANMTQRHIVSVPLKNVKTTSELYDIFYGANVNKRSIPMNKRLYVLEDIDCGGLEDIVNKRSTVESSTEEDKKKDEENKSNQTAANLDKKRELTLSDLLEVFDGVMESKGRMMVITTNHFNKLDSALIRPGRVDTCLEFRKCSPGAVMSVFTNFFGKESIPQGFDIHQVPDNTWTPAQVVQIMVKNSTKPIKGLQTICAKQN